MQTYCERIAVEQTKCVSQAFSSAYRVGVDGKAVGDGTVDSEIIDIFSFCAEVGKSILWPLSCTSSVRRSTL